MTSAFHSDRAAAGRTVVTGAVLAAFLVGLAGSEAAFGAPVALVQHALDYLRSCGGTGPALFAALQVLVAVSGVVPASLMGLAAGAAYGFVPGFALSASGSLLGAVIAFGLSRSLFRSAIERLLSRHRGWRVIDASLSQRGWQFVFLLRLSPVMPFSATSYLLGLSSVSRADYLLGTLACLPALLGYVFVGTLTDAGLAAWSSGGSWLRLTLLAAGSVATLLLMTWLARLVRQRHAGMPMIEKDAQRV